MVHSPHLVLAQFLNIPKVLNRWLLLFYIIEGSEVSPIFRALFRQSSKVKVVRQFQKEHWLWSSLARIEL